MSLQQAFRVKSLGPQMGPRRRLRMKSLGSADYDTWQRYFQPCLKKILKKSRQFLSSEQPCEPKILDVALRIAGVEKNTLEKLVVAVNLEAISFEF